MASWFWKIPPHWLKMFGDTNKCVCCWLLDRSTTTTQTRSHNQNNQKYIYIYMIGIQNHQWVFQEKNWETHRSFPSCFVLPSTTRNLYFFCSKSFLQKKCSFHLQLYYKLSILLRKKFFFLFSLLLQGNDGTYETCGGTSFTLIFFSFYEAPCVILGGTRWWNRFLGISSPSVGNLQSVRRCGRTVIWSVGAAADAVSRAAAVAATHDGFPGGAAARPISGILNNIPQQRLLWVSIYIQNAVFEAWEMCSRYLRWGGSLQGRQRGPLKAPPLCSLHHRRRVRSQSERKTGSWIWGLPDP